jgi:anion-transporting  ArsA/GET3 family ATPase
MGGLLDKRLIFVTGKGGVGKSTVSAALGIAAARRGRRTIVAELSYQDRIARAFHGEDSHFTEVEIGDGLWTISIDPQHALEEYLRLQIRVKAMADLLSGSRVFQYFAVATPGMSELVTMGKVWELAQPERRTKGAMRYDLVIVDAPATGHGVAFLQTPRTFANVARVGPIKAQAEALETFLVNHRKTGVAIVALPEEMPVNETLELEHKLPDAVGARLEAIVVNGLWPERFSAADAETLRASADGVPAVRAALTAYERARGQRSHLRRLRRATEAKVVTLPYLFDAEIGLPEYEKLAGSLARKL